MPDLSSPSSSRIFDPPLLNPRAQRQPSPSQQASFGSQSTVWEAQRSFFSVRLTTSESPSTPLLPQPSSQLSSSKSVNIGYCVFHCYRMRTQKSSDTAFIFSLSSEISNFAYEFYFIGVFSSRNAPPVTVVSPREKSAIVAWLVSSSSRNAPSTTIHMSINPPPFTLSPRGPKF